MIFLSGFRIAKIVTKISTDLFIKFELQLQKTVMKNLIFISILVFAFAFSVMGQSGCPTISVTGPSGITRIGENMTFTAKVDGIVLDKIEYEWFISPNLTITGQKTATINIATNVDMAGMTVTASVKISGLAETCKNEATVSGEIEQQTPTCSLPRIDEYVKLSWRDERVRLESVAVELVNNDKAMAYFIVNTNEKRYSQMLKIRETKIRKYLFEKYKISKERIRLVYGGKGNYRTSVWIIPIDAMPPQ